MSNKDFNFGPYYNDNIRLSPYGMAVKNSSGKWVSYDPKTCQLIDAEVFNFQIDTAKVFYKIPKATSEVVAGDIFLYKDRPVFVEKVRDDGKFEVIDPYEGTAVTILPLTSPFGFNYTTVIVSITDYLPKASADNPFGSLLPFIMGSDNNLLPMLMMMKDDEEIDPMMMAMMCGRDGMSALAVMMMLDKKKGKPRNFGRGASRHCMYGSGIEDMDE